MTFKVFKVNGTYSCGWHQSVVTDQEYRVLGLYTDDLLTFHMYCKFFVLK